MWPAEAPSNTAGQADITALISLNLTATSITTGSATARRAAIAFAGWGIPL